MDYDPDEHILLIGDTKVSGYTEGADSDITYEDAELALSSKGGYNG